MNFRPFTTKNGDELQISTSRVTRADIPADWQKFCVLARYQTERFGYFVTPGGLIAEIWFHNMNGPDDLFIRLGSRAFMKARFDELMAGERWETREAGPMGTVDRRNGRHAKARRVF